MLFFNFVFCFKIRCLLSLLNNIYIKVKVQNKSPVIHIVVQNNVKYRNICSESQRCLTLIENLLPETGNIVNTCLCCSYVTLARTQPIWLCALMFTMDNYNALVQCCLPSCIYYSVSLVNSNCLVINIQLGVGEVVWY